MPDRSFDAASLEAWLKRNRPGILDALAAYLGGDGFDGGLRLRRFLGQDGRANFESTGEQEGFRVLQ